MENPRRWKWGISLLGLVTAIMITLPVLAADTLTDILREKGMITKEDWIRIQAAEEKKAEEAKKREDEEFPVKVGYGNKGFSLETKDGLFKTTLQWRIQLRYAYPESGDPDEPSDFRDLTDPPQSTFQVRRARMKVGGHGYKPWIKYYFEVDWNSGGSGTTGSGGGVRLLDWRVMLEKYKWLQLRLGQWKINFNRMRVDSSGKQQFVDRPITTRVFTIDRQTGAMLYGHLFPGTPADMWYYAFVGNGTGRGTTNNDDDEMMWMGRLQWNFFGRDLKFSQSDVEFHEHPTGSVAFAAVTNTSPFTRFSSSGGGTLSSSKFPIRSTPGGEGAYRIPQWMTELSFKWRGYSLQGEYHWKQINDAFCTGGVCLTKLEGAYIQTGYFFHHLFSFIPKELEIGVRYATINNNVEVSDNRLQTVAGVINWFFAGHRNKLTLDTTHFWLKEAPGKMHEEQQVRFQWDVSF